MKIGDRIIQIHTGHKGYIVTEPELIFNTEQVGIKFDDSELNRLFDPYYCPLETLELWYD